MIPPETCHEIDKVVQRTLKEAGLTEPPILVDDLLEFLRVDHQFYNLEDPGFIDRFFHQLRLKKRRFIIEGKKLLPQKTVIQRILQKVKLGALWLPDQNRILVNNSLPKPKQVWASFHDTVHTLLEWHRGFFIGDTIKSLEPEYQEMLEAEANYGCSTLMFGGKIFTKEALDTPPCWESLEALKKRHKKSWVTTLRRYVRFSHDLPMAMMVSTPSWREKPDDQEDRCRHFVVSNQFHERFGSARKDVILSEIDKNTCIRSGGPVGEFEFELNDIREERYEFLGESFFNRHYILTLIIFKRKIGLVF